MITTLTGAEARALAVDAQLLAAPRPQTTISPARLVATIEALGAVQLDAINIVERTQFLVLFSRLGPFDRSLLFGIAAPNGPVWEYWGHAASLLPVELHPHLRWRMEHGGSSVPGPVVAARIERWRAAQAGYIASVLAEVAARGPLTAGDLSDPRRKPGEWWDRRSHGREALEWLFGRGTLAAWRAPNFARVYDLPERVIRAGVLDSPTPPADAAQRHLVMRAAHASGVATAADLASYFMLQPRVARLRVNELVDEGSLLPVSVEGWTEPAYMPRERRRGRSRRTTATLLSPFDSLIWNRTRTRRLFDFDYTIEVYVPPAKRVYGYYVLPLLLGDELVARFDVKADRRASVLRVLGAFAEADRSRSCNEIAAAAAIELHALRAWLGLDDLAIGERGNLAKALAGESVT